MVAIRVGRLARMLSVHRNTIGNWIKSGKLKAKATVGKRYLIETAELQRFCAAARIPQAVLDALISPPAAAPGAVATSDEQISPTPTHHSEVRMSGKPIGSVMVVGGGIAGIQASLDLANSGFFVHLVERSAGIGGAMSQLDKTFPTNDCAM